MDDEIKMNVSFSTDDDGFLSQECPACEKRFKVKFGEGSDRPIAFCPYCGHNGQNCWWTKEQADYVTAKVGNEIIEPELEDIARDFNGQSKGGFIGLSMDVSKTPSPLPPEEPNEPWPTMTFTCCGEMVKHDGRSKSLRCIICGEDRATG